MPLSPVRRTSVADAVYEQLLDGVLTGELSAGEALPGERALTETLGVNRQAVREALQRLAAAGLVEIRHGDATRVLDYRHAAGLDLLPRLLVLGDGTVDATVARSLMELRLCLGPDVARRCAERAGGFKAAAIAEHVEAMVAAGDDLEALADADLGFWDALVDGAGNIAYRLAFNGLRRTYEPIAALLRETLADELRDHASRRVIAAAVASGDGEAAAAGAQRLLTRGAEAIERLLHELTDHGGSSA
jgi:GntR family transcriptional regulator, transcriptional repressor for pyruvate dehydrogenase complex